eukprot:TRINITY_DN37929_c0_g1_i1.p2 TRINITY_DN37929_c0_g1~~TRINITY_DN37929_c0_g1_i1.p2  ORF type:complete len:237 (+),score=42.06 TRINITY_DN37929_c0_g1_i1:425-1135(+)
MATVCANVQNWCAGRFTIRQHRAPLDDSGGGSTGLPRASAVAHELASPAAARWATALLGEQVGNLSDASAWVYRPLDFNTPHTDTGSSQRMLALTVHLPVGPGGSEWDPLWGGNFIWCGPSRTPYGAPLGAGGLRGKWATPAVSIPARWNQLVLFAVTQDSWHFVQPVRSAPPDARRISLQAWWQRPSAADPAAGPDGECHTGSPEAEGLPPHVVDGAAPRAAAIWGPEDPQLEGG